MNSQESEKDVEDYSTEDTSDDDFTDASLASLVKRSCQLL